MLQCIRFSQEIQGVVSVLYSELIVRKGHCTKEAPSLLVRSYQMI